MIKTSQLFICFFSAFLFLLFSCKKNPSFVWEEYSAEITDKNIGEWLRKSPFKNEFDQKGDDKHFVLSNVEEIFPFMGKYYNAVGPLKHNHYNDSEDQDIYLQENVVYEDPDLGNLFVSATLLHSPKEVFLDKNYLETGNPYFEQNSHLVSHNASLSQTGVFTKNNLYKTGIYWVHSEVDSYLLGFYQRGQLIFETAIPIMKGDTLASLNTLKEVQSSLKINIKEWQNAKLADLKQSLDVDSFWKDPYVSVYSDEQLLYTTVSLKLKDTSFKEKSPPVKGDRYFSYSTARGNVELYTTMNKTKEKREDFGKSRKEFDKYPNASEYIYFTEDSSKSLTTGKAEVYLKDFSYVEIGYSFPSEDKNSRKVIHEILKTAKVHPF